jgi:hypothetical protein
VHEDYELGYRLLKGGAEFIFVEEAWGYHHERSTLNRILRRKYEEGRADVLLGHRHPELRPILPLTSNSQNQKLQARVLRNLASSHPSLGDGMAGLLKGLLAFSEYARNRKRWSQLLRLLFLYWYWRGVAACLPSVRDRLNFVYAPLPRDEDRSLEIDLETGLEAAEALIDDERPDAIRIRYGRRPIGWIPPVPGAERLRGVHLRRELASVASARWHLLASLALEHRLNPASLADACADTEAAPHGPSLQQLIIQGAHS